MERTDIYTEITNKILEYIEKGVLPWRQPWANLGIGSHNKGYISHRSGAKYSFLNCLMLGLAGKQPGEFLTFKQAKEAGGTIKKGSKSARIYFYSIIEKKGEDENGEEIVIGKYPVLKGYNVFSLADCEGVKPNWGDKETPDPNDNTPEEDKPQQIVNAYLENGGPTFRIRQIDTPIYDIAEDTVTVPTIRQHNTEGDFWCTTFHELAHSTGHPDRLNRKKSKDISDYSREELVAELTSAMLCGVAGIRTNDMTQASAAYIKGWWDYLKQNKRDFVIAAAQAEKAANYILGDR